MKKRISLFVATLLAVMALPVAVFADSNSTQVSGQVFNNGKPASGASVLVSCDGNSLPFTTTSHGYYSVTFSPGQCSSGSTAFVTATAGSKSGANNGPVDNAINVNLASINVSVPEFGVIAGVSAAILGGGAFMLVRRKQLKQN